MKMDVGRSTITMAMESAIATPSTSTAGTYVRGLSFLNSVNTSIITAAVNLVKANKF